MQSFVSTFKALILLRYLSVFVCRLCEMALANSSVEDRVDADDQNPNGNFGFRNTTTHYYQLIADHHHHHHQSLINFKSCGIDDHNIIFHKNNNIIESNLLSFEPQQGVCSSDQHTYNWNDIDDDDDQQRLMDHPNCFQTATNNYTSPSKDTKNIGDGGGSVVYEWLYSEPTTTLVSDALHDQDEAAHDIATQKRSHVGESSGGICKKQCTTTKKQKPKSSTAKDPQSIAAKNRRERISERLKILQELVPNGSKVDLVTMLEKAISYVKFLQLQVKILATDEFWPVQGGKAPDISQVKEAIDVILSSQRERSSSSNSEK